MAPKNIYIGTYLFYLFILYLEVTFIIIATYIIDNMRLLKLLFTKLYYQERISKYKFLNHVLRDHKNIISCFGKYRQ